MDNKDKKILNKQKNIAKIYRNYLRQIFLIYLIPIIFFFIPELKLWILEKVYNLNISYLFNLYHNLGMGMFALLIFISLKISSDYMSKVPKENNGEFIFLSLLLEKTIFVIPILFLFIIFTRPL